MCGLTIGCFALCSVHLKLKYIPTTHYLNHSSCEDWAGLEPVPADIGREVITGANKQRPTTIHTHTKPSECPLALCSVGGSWSASRQTGTSGKLHSERPSQVPTSTNHCTAVPPIKYIEMDKLDKRICHSTSPDPSPVSLCRWGRATGKRTS